MAMADVPCSSLDYSRSGLTRVHACSLGQRCVGPALYVRNASRLAVCGAEAAACFRTMAYRSGHGPIDGHSGFFTRFLRL